ncbi:MAG: NIPSNAP family containing protein, partial [Verrucomicrobiota bacterium]
MKKSLLSIISLLAVATVAMAEEKQEYYELRTYHFASAEKAALFDKTAKEALMPALKRLGIGPVGVFQLQKGEKFEGEEDKVLRMVVIPHQTLESVGSLGEKLGEDSAFLEAAGDYLSSAIKDPVFTRMQSTLMHAFKAWP